eukprot:XP_022270580.1 peptidyl-prolyl cis-trans isomerase FKBP7 isoform X3 [Canis lupus familiaris]
MPFPLRFLIFFYVGGIITAQGQKEEGSTEAVKIEVLHRPENCSKSSKKGDLLNAHYDGYLASDGSKFYCRDHRKSVQPHTPRPPPPPPPLGSIEVKPDTKRRPPQMVCSWCWASHKRPRHSDDGYVPWRETESDYTPFICIWKGRLWWYLKKAFLCAISLLHVTSTPACLEMHVTFSA